MKRPEGDPHVHQPKYDLDESLKAEEELRASGDGGGGGADVISGSEHSLDAGRAGGFGAGAGAGARGFGVGFDNLLQRRHGGGITPISPSSPSGGSNNNADPLSALSGPLSPDVIQAAKDVRYIAERASGNNQDDQVAGDWTYIGKNI